MTYITYSHPKLRKEVGDKVIRLFNIVKTTSTPDLWIKVFVYRPEYKYWSMDVKQEQLQFYFGDRFKIEDVKLQKKYPALNWRGHYRWAETFGHGFYDAEWKFINRHPKVKHCITLKFGENCSDKEIAHLIAHEFRHYLQYRKYGLKMMGRKESYNGKRKRPVQVERDAIKWENDRVNKLIAEGKL
jgi:hypothetical protein